MHSMTGYGKAEYNQGGISLTVEIKTVNNRNFDLNTKAPRAFIALDDCIRKTVQKFIKRGRIDLFVINHPRLERVFRYFLRGFPYNCRLDRKMI